MNLIELPDPKTIDLANAVHETGHVVLREVLGLPYDRVAIEHDGMPLGITWFPPFVPASPTCETDRARLRRELLCTLGGLAAERLIATGRSAADVALGASDDLAYALQLVALMGETEGALDDYMNEAAHLLNVNHKPVGLIVRALMRHRSLTPATLRVAIAGYPLRMP